MKFTSLGTIPFISCIILRKPVNLHRWMTIGHLPTSRSTMHTMAGHYGDF